MKRLSLMLSIVTLLAVTATESTRAQEIDEPILRSSSEIISAAREAAIEQVMKSTKSDNVRARVNAVEASRNLPDRVAAILEGALEDKHEAVRFAALVTAGQMQLNELKDSIQPRLEDPSSSVRGAAIFASRKIGLKVDPSPLATMLMEGDPTERGNAAMLLGLLGDKSAATMLAEAAKMSSGKRELGHELIFRLQVAEAIARLLDGERNDFDKRTYDQAVESLHAAAWAPSPQRDEMKVFAITMLGHLGNKRYYGGIRKFVYLQPDPQRQPGRFLPIEVRLAAAEYTARVGEPVGREVVQAAAASEIMPVRAQAAMILGLYDDAVSAQRLTELLNDQSELVRVAAAASVLGNAKRSVASR